MKSITRRHRNTRASRRQTFFFSTLCHTTGAMMVVPLEDEAIARRYLELHAILPSDLMSWEASDLEELAAEVVPEDTDTWERALILLAHHGSRRASALIKELAGQVPEDLRAFAELAYAESLGWLGFDYVRESHDARPVIRPTRAAMGA